PRAHRDGGPPFDRPARDREPGNGAGPRPDGSRIADDHQRGQAPRGRGTTQQRRTRRSAAGLGPGLGETMGTLTEEIFSRRLGRPVHAGEIVVAPVDYAMAHDVTGPLAIEAFRKLDVPLWDP